MTKNLLDWSKFLVALSEHGTIKAACRVADISRSAATKHREADPDFAKAWDLAIEEAGEGLEAEARRRAVEGVQKPLLSMGKIVMDPANPGKMLMETTYSDKLLEVLLRACNKKFAAQQVIPQSIFDKAREGGLDAIANDSDPEREDRGKKSNRGAGTSSSH